MQNFDPCLRTEVQLAREQLFTLAASRIDDRKEWIRVAAALKGVDPSLESDFVLWSMRSKKYGGERECRELFRSLDGTSGEVLSRMAREDGWQPTDSTTTIIIGTDETKAVDAAILALQKAEGIYQRGGCLCRVTTPPPRPSGVAGDAEPPRIELLPGAALREELTKHARFVRESKGKEVPCHVTQWLVNAIEARSSYAVPPIEAVSEVPVLRRDGSVIRSPGFDLETGVYFAPSVEFARVDDVGEAREALLALFVDFPFAEDAHRSAMLAAMLTPLARLAFHGPSPLHLIDANTPGSGKGLSVDVISLIACGRTMPVTSAPESDAEWRKRITAIAIAGDPTCLIDNVDGQLASPSLDAALTSTTWSDRVLGVSKVVTLPLRATFYATGNNVSLHRDTLRRTNYCRLESTVENPETRSGFKIPNLIQHVRERRGYYTACALAILQGYCRDGRPDQKLPPLGSFEGWSDLVRSAVVWCGLPDPMVTRIALTASSDQETTLRQLLAGWQETDVAGHGLTAAEAIAIASPTLRAAIDDLDGGKDWKHALGLALRKYKGRVCGGLSFVKTERGKTSVWKVQK